MVQREQILVRPEASDYHDYEVGNLKIEFRCCSLPEHVADPATKRVVQH